MKIALAQIAGKPGVGKLALLKRLVEQAGTENPVLLLNLTGLWMAAGQALPCGTNSSTNPLIYSPKWVPGRSQQFFIDGLDRVQRQHRNVVRENCGGDINQLKSEQLDLVATVRDGLTEHLKRGFHPALDDQLTSLNVPAFNDQVANELAELLPNLRALLFAAPAIREISRRLFFLDVLTRLPERKSRNCAPKQIWLSAGGLRVDIHRTIFPIASVDQP